jgi:uncharacterized coiled-coil DUF342 family protein
LVSLTRFEELAKLNRALSHFHYLNLLWCKTLQIEALKTQLGNLKSKAETCKEEIEQTLDSLDRATDNLRRTRTSIDRASDELDMHEPIGTDVAAIKRQQDELQVKFQVNHCHLQHA